MRNSYIDKYDILEIFKDDAYQKILIGTSKENPNEVAVINLLSRDKFKDIISASQFQKGLNNLVHLKVLDDKVVVVTEYKEGTPLDTYLNYFNTTLKHKINLAYEYLTKIVKYDVFNNSLKNIFIDESQVILKNDVLLFNELIIFDENFEKIHDFSKIAKKIGLIMEKIIFTTKSDENETFENDRTIKRSKNLLIN
ncbi:MAG: hypothetical protein PWQ37_1778 [Candidatus Petromonas sp.]|jgi:hypothetical protein|nr:hypothetical protein [Candidatus Petromonas sp.]